MKNQGDLFYLGGILGDIWPTRKWGIAGGRMFCTQSYVMNRKGMEKLASLPYAGTPVDVLYYMEFESFAYYPMLTSQVAGNVVSSDIASVRTGNNNPMSGFWRQNNAAQYWSLLKNWPKSFR
jgi:glycosyl transferase family 25